MTQTAPPKAYRNSPIEEALVEFQFATDQEWDLTIPGKLHERLKAVYSGKPRQQKLVQASVQAVGGQPAGFSMHEGVVRVQLIDPDARRLLSLGPGVISINAMRPYEGWVNFRPRIEEALTAYANVSGAQSVGRIGVRYVNKVVIPQTPINPEQYFHCVPAAPPGLPVRRAAFLTRSEHTFEDGVKLLLTLATVDAEKDTSAFLLDLDVIWEDKETVDATTALSKAEDMHVRVKSAFEAVVTSRAREVFDATDAA